ncbi:hypothetical protein ACFQL7_22290 [Halocatena marina]|uniref:Uncharacterized protein n=2 Tax=Halocatena marina TaxID=2934937 RepID=A0ABD5YWA0_9EURY
MTMNDILSGANTKSPREGIACRPTKASCGFVCFSLERQERGTFVSVDLQYANATDESK